MIYQCYFAREQEAALFAGDPYRPFGLEPEVNPRLYLNCPELQNRAARTHLNEYAAMLHLWRNPADTDRWIGFCSWRQPEKTPGRFGPADRALFERLLARAHLLGWGFLEVRNALTHEPASLAEASEVCHPGINAFLADLLGRFGRAVPAPWGLETIGLFANYWVMSKVDFIRFMEWSWPLVEWCLGRPEEPFVASHPRAVGFVAERLFILWYLGAGKRLMNVGVTGTLAFRTPEQVAAQEGAPELAPR